MLSLSQFGFYTICAGLRLGFVRLCALSRFALHLHSERARGRPGPLRPRGISRRVGLEDMRLLPKQPGQRLQAESGPGNRRACDLLQFLDLSVIA